MDKKKTATKDVKKTKKANEKKTTIETTKVEEKEITIEAIEALIKSEEEVKKTDEEKKEETKKKTYNFLSGDGKKLKFIEKLKIVNKLNITESIEIMTINRKVTNGFGDFNFNISYSHSEIKDNNGVSRNEGHILIKTKETSEHTNYLRYYNNWWVYNAEYEISPIFCDLLKETDELICKRLDEIITEEWNKRNANKDDLANKQY